MRQRLERHLGPPHDREDKTMDLSNAKVTDREKADLCRRYFCLGFALLPFLWAVNAVWFFREAFLRRPGFPEQKELRRYAGASAALAALSLGAAGAWLAAFVAGRTEWGELGDRLSFNIPTGSP